MNPSYPYEVNTISNRAPSTTQPTLQTLRSNKYKTNIQCLQEYFIGCQKSINCKLNYQYFGSADFYAAVFSLSTEESPLSFYEVVLPHFCTCVIGFANTVDMSTSFCITARPFD